MKNIQIQVQRINPETDMMAPFRGFPPYSELPVPAYSFQDDTLKKTYLGKKGKAKIGTFWGSNPNQDQIYYCINPNSVDPVTATSYFQINPKYDYQSNYHDVPELHYMLATLLNNAKMFN